MEKIKLEDANPEEHHEEVDRILAKLYQADRQLLINMLLEISNTLVFQTTTDDSTDDAKNIATMYLIKDEMENCKDIPQYWPTYLSHLDSD